MQTSLQITFKNLDRSPHVEEKIRERAAKLGRCYTGILSCHVIVELLHRHHRHGNHYHVRVDVTVPGDQLVSTQEPEELHAYTDVYVAIRDAFDVMDRMVEDHVRRTHPYVMAHEGPLQGRVAELHHTDDYGRIETTDGRVLYFHRDSMVQGDFDELGIGSEVRFVEEQGDRGLQAGRVQCVSVPHLVG